MEKSIQGYGNWNTRVMIIGAITGALTGLLAAYILIKRAEVSEGAPKLSPGEGVQLGLGVLGLLRLISK